MTETRDETGPRRLILLRHGVTEHNARGIWQGHLDTDLAPAGLAQAQAAAAVLVRYRPSFIVSSDLGRAAQTTRIVASACGVEPSYDARLREIHVGAWQGLDSAGVEELFPGAQARITAGEDLRRGGDGETVSDVVRRARPAVDELVRVMQPGQAALVVSHGVCARALAADLAGMDQRTAWTALAGLGNCSWAELTESASGWRISLWNGRAEGHTGSFREGHGY